MDELQLVSDGDGLAVIGESQAVERFLAAESLPARDLGGPRLARVLSTAGVALQQSTEVATNVGRWVKLTEESAAAMDKLGLRKNPATGLATGVLRGDHGQIKGFVEFAQGPGQMLTNPAVLSGVGGMMTQMALQQTMDEIAAHLERIDQKVDDILRSQRDAVVADLIGVGLLLDDAMKVRAEVGRVSEVTWSQVQGAALVIASTQAYALLQVDHLAEQLEQQGDVGGLVDSAHQAARAAQEWLAVLERCFQLADALSVLELDRVMDVAPEELERHRAGVRLARQGRLDAITSRTETLLGRMDDAVGRANARVLTHPTAPRALLASRDVVMSGVADLHDVLGVTGTRRELTARSWSAALTDAAQAAVASGTDRVESTRRLGGRVLARARESTEQVGSRLPGRRSTVRDQRSDPSDDD